MKKVISILFLLITLISCGQNEDTIIGVWNVKNDYYHAVYEIVAYKGKFYGKTHYYNDGKTAYKGNNKKEDYFLTDVEKKEGNYVNGKMYMPNGSYYNIVLTLKDKDTLEALMTVSGNPYKEVWSRAKMIKNIFPK